MDNDQIVSKMNQYLHQSTNILVDWLGKLLPKAANNWWEECVLDNLSYRQQETAREKRFTELGQFDLAALLRIADKSWYAMRNVIFLPNRERECIRDMMRVRNNWAHVSALLPGKDVILLDLATVYDFFEQRGCENELLKEVNQVIEEIKSPSSDNSIMSNLEQYDKQIENTILKNKEANEIAEKSLVYLTGNPDVHGIVMSVTDLGDTKKYDVFVDGVFKTYYSGQIALYVGNKAFNWVDINTFRSYLTAYQINNPTGNNLYSLNSARIDFVPYQFRPALKLIHADEPRLLIADSVGVGKTIEAGLIIKELQARNELENVLIICPKPLVTDRKWETEMKRFDEDFSPVDGPTLRQIFSDYDRDGEWPIRYSKAIIPYSVLDSRAYAGERKKKKQSIGLLDLDPAPHFDLVIIDEAHHIRNGSLKKEKAYEYKCVKKFCDNANAVVMLTATPLQTSDDDLFTLLNLLRPDVIIDKQTFNMMSRPNVYISKAVSLMRRAEKGWQAKAIETLRGVLETQWGENVIAANPVYSEIIKTLQQDKITREKRVELISDLESLHSFNSMLNRTRRKDIQDFCIRRPYTLAVKFTTQQKKLYDELLRFEASALLQLHRNSRSIPFMMSTIKRQAASCIFGLAPHIRDLINKRFQQIENDLNEYNLEFEIDGEDITMLESMAEDLLAMADTLPIEDPKFDQMLEVVLKKKEQQNNKIIIFSTFRYTLGYLKNKLLNVGLRVAQIDGSVKDDMRQDLRDRFKKPKEDKDAIDILLFTEVGSEGLDYQFCDTMINYDLPWNPMKIEQRIGRIDRRGQQSETVSIYNMITEDTVDANIYYRCLMRIGIFEHSIGECEKILGDIAAKIDRIAMDMSLTDDEKKIKLEQMADNEVRQLQELNKLEEEERELFGFNLSEFITSQEIHNAENPWLTPNSLQIMVEQYLLRKVGPGNYILGEKDIKQLRLSYNARMELRDDFRKLSNNRNAMYRQWDYYLKGKDPLHLITFDSETADNRRDAFFITAMHPLAKQAASFFASNDQAFIKIQYVTNDLPIGNYQFAVYAWNYTGINPHFRLVTVCEDTLIAKELPDILQECQSYMATDEMQLSDWEELEKKQVKMWMDEKAMVQKEAENISTYKTESLFNNYRNKKRSLEQKIADTNSESVLRMYAGELEAATDNYKQKIEIIRKQVEQTDIHTTLIANGILAIVK